MPSRASRAAVRATLICPAARIAAKCTLGRLKVQETFSGQGTLSALAPGGSVPVRAPRPMSSSQGDERPGALQLVDDESVTLPGDEEDDEVQLRLGECGQP